MNSPSNLPLLKVVGCCAFLTGTALSQDSLSQGQDYRYSGGRYEGLSSDVVINGVLDAPGEVANTIGGASAFLSKLTTFGAWTDLAQPHGYAGVGGMANVVLPNIFMAQSHPNGGGGGPGDPYFAYRMGPFYVDQVYGGLGAMYSDLQGTPPSYDPVGREQDDWAGVAWLSARFTAYVTDRFAISVNPFIYWLPLENEVGWAVGRGMLGLNGWLTPQSAATLGFNIPVGRWNFAFHDRFEAFYVQNNILNENVFIDAYAGDMSPIDMAGRYQFGGLGPSWIDLTGDSDLATNNRLFRSDGLFFRNNALFSATAPVADSLSFTAFYNRNDFWNDRMRNIGSWDTTGALLSETAGNFRPYAAYQSTSYDDWSSSYNWALVGAAFQVNPQVVGYANAGYLWTINGGNNVGAENDQDSWLGIFGVRHHISPYTYHVFEAGRAVTDPDFNARTRSDYASYMISQVLGPRLTMSLFAMHADRVYLGDQRRNLDHRVTAVGTIGSFQLTDRSNLSLYASFERLAMNEMDTGWDMWTYRATYLRRIGHSTVFNLMYQYQDAGRPQEATTSFSEHLIYAGIIKRF